MKYLYEFIGTFFLVFTVGMTVLEPNSAGTFAPLAIASALMVMVFAGGHVSGGHYNPAVSLAVFLRGKLSKEDLAKYIGTQLAGSVLAACLVLYLKGGMGQVMAFAPGPVFIAEFLFTFALCFVVLNTATSVKTAGNSFFGLAIGFTVLVGAYAVGSITGGAFNPAVSVSIVIMNLVSLSHLWIYFAAQLLAAGAAAFVFRRAHSEK